jgi:hypothetical protein
MVDDSVEQLGDKTEEDAAPVFQMFWLNPISSRSFSCLKFAACLSHVMPTDRRVQESRLCWSCSCS